MKRAFSRFVMKIERRLQTYDGPTGFDPVPVLARAKAPSLWLLGARDLSTPAERSRQTLENDYRSGKTPSSGYRNKASFRSKVAAASRFYADQYDVTCLASHCNCHLQISSGHDSIRKLDYDLCESEERRKRAHKLHLQLMSHLLRVDCLSRDC